MKRIILILVVFVYAITILAAQQTAAQKWTTFSMEYKFGLIQGFAAGIYYSDKIVSGTEAVEINAQIRGGGSLYDKIGFYIRFDALIKEKPAYWISLIDSFYLKNSNQNADLLEAMQQIYFEELRISSDDGK